MSIGVRLHDTKPGTLAERAEAAREQGFRCAHLALQKAVEPRYAEPAALTPGLASYVSRAVAPLDVALLGCYLNPAHPDEAAYREILRRYTAHLRFAGWLGGCVVGTETGNFNEENRFDPAVSPTDDALARWMDRVYPIVQDAEALGVIFAIEPTVNHIVNTAERTRRVLDELASPNLQVVLDPVNLLSAENVARRDEVIAEALELLGEDTVLLHVKDYRVVNGAVVSMGAGLGDMDYAPIMAYVAKHKPHLNMTLEDTTPENAAACRAHIEALLRSAGGEVD